MRYIFIGAHPDDADILFGGTAIQLARAGHQVRFVSVTNGDAGHQSMARPALARRRLEEAQAAARVGGLDGYDIMGIPDSEVECNLANRWAIIRLLRRFAPDVVITHWLWDYHADHRATGQLVLDAAYLLTVPHCCADTPIPAAEPIYAFAYHRFQDPRPFRADAAVAIDNVLDEKMRMLDCHVSQFYEWLPWNAGFRDFDASKLSWPQKKEWLMARWGVRTETCAALARPLLCRSYGEQQGAQIGHAEAFEQNAYGKEVPQEEFQRIMQGIG